MRRRKNRKAIPLIYLSIVIVVALLFSTIFALIYSTNSNIINNVKINNIKVSGLSKSEAEQKFESILNNITEKAVVLKHGNYEKTFTLKQMELETNIMDKIYQACTIGRDKNIIANNYKILSVLINGQNLELDFKYNEEIMQSIFSNLDAEWEEKFIDNSYYIDGENLVIVRGKSGNIIDTDTLREKIDQLVREKIEGKHPIEIEIPVITKTPEEIDLEKIQKEIYKEPKDASYNEKEGKLSIHADGVDFGISIEEAKQIIAEAKEEYTIPLKITKPAITTSMLGEDAFPDVLASFSTRYDASNISRATNIDLASKAIDGTILMPGERFSFNAIVGPTTKAKGYKPAGAYAGGRLVEDYGGGICQVSSTIYDTALYADLQIVERYNHSSVVSYLDSGLDATITYGSRDLKFANSKKYAIRIGIKATNGILEVEIKGIKEGNEPEIELVSETKEIIPCDTKYIYDSSLAEGQEVVETGGANGAKSIAYKIVKKKGIVQSKTVLSEDSYNPMLRIIKTGSKEKVNK